MTPYFKVNITINIISVSNIMYYYVQTSSHKGMPSPPKSLAPRIISKETKPTKEVPSAPEAAATIRVGLDFKSAD